MDVKLFAILGLALYLCAGASAARISKPVLCEKIQTDDLMEEECDDGTGVSSGKPGEPSNNFPGRDIKGRRVMQIGDDDTCLLDTDPEPLPAYVEEASMSVNKTRVEVTNEDVLDSVRQWCPGKVFALVEEGPLSDAERKKRGLRCYYRCWYFVSGGRLYRYCRYLCLRY